MPEAEQQAFDYAALERNLVAWLATRPDVLGAAVILSAAVLIQLRKRRAAG